MRGPAAAVFVRGDLDGEADFHGEFVDLLLGGFGKARGSFAASCGERLRGGGVGGGAVSFLDPEFGEKLVAVFDLGELGARILRRRR